MNLIFESIAFLDGYKSGFEKKIQNSRKDIYYKNAVVSLLSLRIKNPEDDVALVTNTDIPGAYLEILHDNRIKLIKVDYDDFRFEGDLRYSLSYYKLCSFMHIVSEFDYENYLQVDCDTYCMNALDSIWEETAYHILALEMPYSVTDEKKYVYDDFEKLSGVRTYFQYYGSEFVACNKKDAQKLIEECHTVYELMLEKGVRSEAGDEFIWNVAIEQKCKERIKNASPYIMRVFTIRPYILDSYYQKVCILHVPLEKECALLDLYKYYRRNVSFPSARIVYKWFGLFGLHRPILSYKISHVKFIIRKIKSRICK